MRQTYEASALHHRLGGECKFGDTCRHHSYTLPNRTGLKMNKQLVYYAEALEHYNYLCLLYRLDTEALRIMLQGEGDETRRELIAGEIEARHANRH